MSPFLKKYWSVITYLATFWYFQLLMQTNLLITRIAHKKPEKSIFYRSSQFRIIFVYACFIQHETFCVECVEGRLQRTFINETAFISTYNSHCTKVSLLFVTVYFDSYIVYLRPKRNFNWQKVIILWQLLSECF